MTRSTPRLVAMHAAVACMVNLIAGCAEERPDPPYAKVAIEGRVKRGAEIFRKGWVEVVPVDGGRGVLRSGPIRDDGSFRVEGLGPGQHGIRIVVPRDTTLYPFDRFFSPIRRHLTEEPVQQVEIDLLRESPRPG